MLHWVEQLNIFLGISLRGVPIHHAGSLDSRIF
jgi:hypothetical protein